MAEPSTPPFWAQDWFAELADLEEVEAGGKGNLLLMIVLLACFLCLPVFIIPLILILRRRARHHPRLWLARRWAFRGSVLAGGVAGLGVALLLVVAGVLAEDGIVAVLYVSGICTLFAAALAALASGVLGLLAAPARPSAATDRRRRRLADLAGTLARQDYVLLIGIDPPLGRAIARALRPTLDPGTGIVFIEGGKAWASSPWTHQPLGSAFALPDGPATETLVQCAQWILVGEAGQYQDAVDAMGASAVRLLAAPPTQHDETPGTFVVCQHESTWIMARRYVWPLALLLAVTPLGLAWLAEAAQPGSDSAATAPSIDTQLFVAGLALGGLCLVVARTMGRQRQLYPSAARQLRAHFHDGTTPPQPTFRLPSMVFLLTLPLLALVVRTLSRLWAGVYFYFLTDGGTPSSPRDWDAWQIVALLGLVVLGLAVVVLCGTALSRWVMRAVPVPIGKLERLDRSRLALSLQLVLAVVLLSGGSGIIIIMGPVIHPDHTPDEGLVLGLMVYIPAILAGMMAATLITRRYAETNRYLEQPYVLFLRRFQGLADRALLRALQAALPSHTRLVFLSGPASGAGSWELFNVCFAGFSWRHPLISVPVYLEADDDEWQECVKPLIELADCIVVDTTVPGAAMEFEYHQVAELGNPDHVVWTREQARGTYLDPEPEGIGAEVRWKLPYRPSWLETLPQLMFSVILLGGLVKAEASLLPSERDAFVQSLNLLLDVALPNGPGIPQVTAQTLLVDSGASTLFIPAIALLGVAYIGLVLIRPSLAMTDWFELRVILEKITAQRKPKSAAALARVTALRGDAGLEGSPSRPQDDKGSG